MTRFILIVAFALVLSAPARGAFSHSDLLLVFSYEEAMDTSLCLSSKICWMSGDNFNKLLKKGVLPNSADVGLGHINDYGNFKLVSMRLIPRLKTPQVRFGKPVIRFVFQKIKNGKPKQAALHFTYDLTEEEFDTLLIYFEELVSGEDTVGKLHSETYSPFSIVISDKNLSALTFSDMPKVNQWRFGAVDISNKSSFVAAKVPFFNNKLLQKVGRTKEFFEFDLPEGIQSANTRARLVQFVDSEKHNLLNTDCVSCHLTTSLEVFGPELMHVGFNQVGGYPKLSLRLLAEIEMDKKVLINDRSL